jgi:hypothetical protein
MSSRFPVVLVDDGELDDVRELLLELGVEFAHLRGGAIPRKLEPPGELLLTTMRHAHLARSWPHSADGKLRPVRIAVASEDSATARRSLRRMGFAYLLRPPIHPIALRLLLLRALYRGEERRVHARVPVGVDVSLRTGLRRRDALLADLSPGGCRLVTDRSLPAGARIKIHLPEDIAGEASLALAGQILRCERDAKAFLDGGFSVAVRFATLRDDDRRRLQRVLARREVSLGAPDEGPRVRPLRGETEQAPAPAAPASADLEPAATPTGQPPGAAPSVPQPATAAPQPAPTPQPVAATPTEAAAAPKPEAAPPPFAPFRVPPPPEPGSRQPLGDGGPRLGASLISRALRRTAPPNRRRHARGHYDRRVVAEAAAAMHRMLLGRDVGVGGMRVAPHPDLKCGARLRLALFDASRDAPLVIDAVVARDDGPQGFALHFLGMTPELAARLEGLVAGLPPVEDLTEGEAGSLGTVVGEIVS